MAQMFIVALIIFLDQRPEPLLPRRFDYLNIWAALGVAAGSLVPFAKTGSVAWNGILAWYLLCVSFFVWMVTMTWLMLRSSRAAEALQHNTTPLRAPDVASR
jgi:hypothetical protein